jgi:hypothetical protein
MKRKVEQQITDTDRDYRTGLPSLLYVTSGSSPGFGLYFSVSMPAGKNNANGKIPYQLVPIRTIADTIIRNIPRGLSCLGFVTNTSTNAIISSTITIGTATAAYNIVLRFCVTVFSLANPDSLSDSRPALKLLANI